MNKSLLWLSISVCGLIGSYIPVIFGASAFSLISIIAGGIGSIAGIWVAIKLNGGNY